jgi:hypothetical protein
MKWASDHHETTGRWAVAAAGLAIALFCGPRLNAQPAKQTAWRPENTPEALVAESAEIMARITYLRGSKSRVENDAGKSFEIFQRRLNVGTIESKQVNKRDGRIKSVEYTLADGRFLDSDGELLKFEYERDHQIEARIARSQPTPYGYELLKPAVVGTNECLVVRRTMTAPMLEAVGAELYHYRTNLNEAQRTALARKSVRAVEDIYIRQSDGVQPGSLRRNLAGELLDDRLCDAVTINQPISEAEFVVPNKERAVRIASFQAFGEYLTRQLLKQNSIPKPVSESESMRRKRFAVLASCLLLSVTGGALLARRLWHRDRG